MIRDDKPKTVYWLEDKLYLNITNKCSNKCTFCFKNFKRGITDFTLKLDSEPTFEQVTTELESARRTRKWKEVVFCGFGEPTERLDLLMRIARYLKKTYGGKTIVRLNTNGHGYVLNKGRDVVEELREAGVEKVSVSLNAADEEKYIEICRPAFPEAFAAALDLIKRSRSRLDVEVTAVTSQEVDLHKVEELTKDLGVRFRLRQCVPCFW